MVASATKNLNRLTGRNPLAYLGVEPISPPEQLIATVPPPTNITSNMALGTQWLVANPGAEEIWELVNITGNTAKWVALYPAMLQILTIVTDAGSAVETGGTINLLGDGNITTTGAGNTVNIDLSDDITIDNLTLTGTLTLSSLGAGVMQTDPSGVVSSSAPLPISLGGTNATTMATTNGVVYFNGSRLVTTSTGTAAQVLTSNGGVIAPSFQDVSSLGVVNELSADVGFATPVSGIIDIAGGNSISTSGAGNTITINVSGTTDHAVQVGNNTGSLSSIGVGTNGQVLIGSTGANPSFAALTSSGSTLTYSGGAGTLNIDVTAPLDIAHGGTNATSMTNTDGVVYYDGTRLVTTTSGSAAEVLTSNGAGFAPTFQTLPPSGILQINADTGSATPLLGIIDIFGGNNISTSAATNVVTVSVSGTTNHAVQVGNSTGSLTSLTPGTNGQLLIGSTGVDPKFAALTSTASTLTYTAGAGSLNIDVTAPLDIAHGGTNATSMATTDGVVYFDGTRLVTTAVGTAGNLLTSNGAGVAPTYQSLSTTNHAVQVGNSSGMLTSLGVGTNGQVLIGSTGANPTFATVTSSASTLTYTLGAGTLNIDVTAPLDIAHGGTNATSMSNNFGVNYYDGTKINTTSVGSLSQVLTSNGAGNAPTFQTISSLSLGTTNHAVQVGNASGTLTSLTVGTSGQLLIGSTGANPVFATLTSTGSTITITGGAGTLNIDTAGSVAKSFTTDSGTATPSSGVLKIAGGSNINTSGATNVVTVNLNNSPSVSGSVTAGTGFTATTGGLTITAGDINLPATGSTTGNINVSGANYFSAYAGSGGANNLFMAGAGNYTLSTASGNQMIGPGSGASLTTGLGNVGFGQTTLNALTTGNFNFGLGFNAGSGITTGVRNVFLGVNAGSSLTGAEGSNIIIVNSGVVGDGNTIRIGTQGAGLSQQNKCFIAGIRGTTTANNNAIAVLVDSAGQLGTISSSRTVKDNIRDMEDGSEALFSLRPVFFTYKQDPNKDTHWGLIAEEVDEVFPALTVRDDEGELMSVRYHELPVLLLNELKKMRLHTQQLEQRIKILEGIQ